MRPGYERLMFPALRQRIAILIFAIVGGLLYLQAVPVARAADGSEGCTLVFAASSAEAIGTFALFSIPVVILAALVSSLGSPLAGVFTMAVAAIFAAVGGGSIDQWVRAAPGASAYWGLALDAALWAVGAGAAILACYWLSGHIRLRLPARWRADDHWRDEMDHDAVKRHELFWGFDPPSTVGVLAALSQDPTSARPSRWEWAAGSGIICLLVGGVLSQLLIQSAEVWQVTWGAGLGFAFAALIAHQLVPVRNPIFILLSPIVAAMLLYALFALGGGDRVELLQRYFDNDLPGAALGLPIFHASAGVAGAAVGVGWSEVLILAHLAEKAANESRSSD